MSIRRLLLGLIPSLCILTGTALLTTTPALAREVHVYSSTFGSAGSAPGELDAPAGIAVNNATHDLYVVDKGNNRIEEFSAAGAPIGEFDGTGSPSGAFSEPTEVAVDNSGDPLDPSKEDVYVLDQGHGVIDKFSPSGTYQGELTGANTPTPPGGPPGGLFEPGEADPRSLQSVTVDATGKVWVSIENGTIYAFTSEGAFSSERRPSFDGAAPGLGVDGEDNIYFRAYNEVVAKINSAGEILLNPFGDDTHAFSVAVDRQGEEVYLDNFESIEAFSLVGAPLESFGSGHLAEGVGIAVDESDGNVYVTNRAADTVSVFEGISLPGVALGAVTDQTPRSVTLNGTVSPEGKPLTSCKFEYVEASKYEAGAAEPYAHATKVPCEPGELGEGKVAVAVKAQLKGLTPGTTYHYRLTAENAAHVPSSTADSQFVAGPILGDEYAAEVAASSATLQARLDPNGAQTSYYFEYGPGTAYGSFAPVGPPGVNLSSALGALPLRVHLQGLEAGVGYHYRLVAVQAGEVFAGPDHTFSTQGAGGSAALADGRAWELVTPVDKHGALIEPLQSGGQVQAAADGDGIAYTYDGGSLSEDPAGKAESSQALSTRGPDGWSTVDLTLPQGLPENGEPAELLYQQSGFEYRLFSPDLSLAAVEPAQTGTPLLAPEATERTLYLRDDLSGVFLPLVSPANVPPGTRIEEPNFIGVNAAEWEMHLMAATSDLAHVVFRTPLALTPEAVDEETVEENVKKGKQNTARSNLYEWNAGSLQLVNILPGNGGVAHGREKTIPPVTLAGVTTVSSTPGPHGGVQRAVSNDGRRIAWTWGEPYTPAELAVYRGLYVRDMVEERTVRVGGPDALYQTMNSEGSKIFFLEHGDLYVYDFETETSTDLTANHGASETSGGVQELVSDVSEDGSYVYFVATGALAEGGVSGADNLYLLHQTGSGWTTTQIATLSREDNPDWYAAILSAPDLAGITSRVSPDGRYLVFLSNRPLTGYDNTDAMSGEPDEEVYEYDAQARKLICASCDPTSARPTGISDNDNAELLVDPKGILQAKQNTPENPRFTHWLAGSVPGWDGLNNDPVSYQPRYLSNSGRMFFDSPVGLVPQDTNKLEDVYQYEPEGIGDCTSATSSATDVYVKEIAGRPDGGCVGLISSGTSSTESAFYDASENGDDVFFDSTAKLSGADTDKAYDLYDAHVCTSEVPCSSTPVAPPACDSGDSCKAAPSPQPEIFGAPPSATFNGAGNLAPSVAVPVVKKSLTRAQKLSAALKVCAKDKSKARRTKCQKQARAKYGAVKKGRKS